MCEILEQRDDGTMFFVDDKSGFEITNPFLSTCGRFDVDPVEQYDIDLETPKHMVEVNGCLGLEDL